MPKETHLDEYAQLLAGDGVVVIEEYLDSAVCNRLYRQIINAIEDNMEVTDKDYSYGQLVGWGGAVIDKRTGRDEGMWDIFNIDEEVPEIRSIKKDTTINTIINEAAGEEFYPNNINVYWNRSVTETREFHADSYSQQYKAFVYLTDVPNLTYGPFGYVKGTQGPQSRYWRKATQLLNKFRGRPRTDAAFYRRSDAEFFTAPRGTLIIANQSGFHRGYPQEKGRERMLLATSYLPSESGASL